LETLQDKHVATATAAAAAAAAAAAESYAKLVKCQQCWRKMLR
jgi:hypothetical protein